MSSTGAAGRITPIKVTRPGTGAQIGEYRIIRSLGSGGMGQVFAARRIGGDDDVALKQLSSIDPTLLYRFKQEFRSLADLSHPNLVRLGELVLLPGNLAFFTMELVDGEPLARWVRRAAPAGTLPNLHRLCHALRQLAAGVAHLHHAAKVHRDLKPSNVLVTAEGRVVILDFGLVYELGDSNARITASGQMVGTPAYMAPEQIHQRTIGTAVDLYAIGVTLFECLTGCMPFAGSISGVLSDKQREPAPDPRELAEGVPEWLACLCRALLDVDPEARPSADTVIEILDRNGEAAPASAVVTPPDARLFGRDRELSLLGLAHGQVADAGATIVQLTGPLGRGKTALVDHFLRCVGESDVVLRGRCHLRESVPFKGVDSIVDALALYLRALPELDAAALRPRHVRELCELFPVLRGTWPEPTRMAVEREPVMRRQLGVAALRDVLARIADTHALIVAIDDFHWGDLDGLEVLGELLAGPSAPALLLILAYDPSVGGAMVERLTAGEPFTGLRQHALELPPLAETDARALARVLIDLRMVDDVELSARELARSSDGEPLAIVRGAAAGKLIDNSVEVDEQVVRRIRSLDPESRLLLELATIAGVPLANTLVREVLSSFASEAPADAAGFEIVVCELVMAGLLGVVALDSRGAIKLSQPRVGELVRVELDGERRRKLHLSLASALAEQQADAELVADHFERGGDRERARLHMTEAAHKAAEALAFARAERLYRRALELLPADLDDACTIERRELQLALADQLTNLARSPDAEHHARASADVQASKLRLRAAEQYAIAARSQPTLAGLRALLRNAGERLPATELGALLTWAWNHTRLALHRGWLARHSVQAFEPRRLSNFDLVHAVAQALPPDRQLLAAALRPRVMHLALAAGEPLRLVVALRTEVMRLLANGRGEAAARGLVQVQHIASQTDEPLIHAHAHATSHAVRVHRAERHEAELAYRRTLAELERCPGETALQAELFERHVRMLAHIGEHSRMFELVPSQSAQLRAAGRPRDAGLLLAHEVIARAQRHELVAARRGLMRARACVQGETFDVLDSTLGVAEVWLMLAQGRHEEALAGATRLVQDVQQHELVHVPDAWLPVLDACIRARLGVAIACNDARALPRAGVIRRLRRGGSFAVRVHADVLAAGRASMLGEREREQRLWRRALEGCRRMSMHAVGAAVAWRLAELGGDDAGELRMAARGWFAEAGVDDIEAFVACVAPAPPSRGIVRMP